MLPVKSSMRVDPVDFFAVLDHYSCVTSLFTFFSLVQWRRSGIRLHLLKVTTPCFGPLLAEASEGLWRGLLCFPLTLQKRANRCMEAATRWSKPCKRSSERTALVGFTGVGHRQSFAPFQQMVPLFLVCTFGVKSTTISLEKTFNRWRKITTKLAEVVMNLGLFIMFSPATSPSMLTICETELLNTRCNTGFFWYEHCRGSFPHLSSFPLPLFLSSCLR
mmetsp:Transcript_13725/g.26585  ORF Transcript_13725/g.26585 Transcript_13725/m.26585 type:complete len:219 (-) Transcript_13725:2022-2678(-)